MFNKNSFLYQVRWFVAIFIIAAGLMLWYDLTGRRMLSFNNQQQWSSSGPGYHK